MRASLVLGLSCIVAPGLAAAQERPAPVAPPAPAQADDEGDAESNVVVTGSRSQPGAVIGDIPPEQQLGPADIRSYGVSSLSDLLNELSPQTRSDRGSGGAPVVLLNGRRIGSFAEIRDIPTEAIQRVDILPEEVALKYGYRADQRVVNVVLRRRFRATTAELADAVPTEGGRNSPDANLDLLHIVRDGRFNLHLRYQQSSALLESERDIAAADASGASDPGYRTLLPRTQTFNANAVYARTILGNVGATLNGRVETTDSRGLQGLGVFTGGALAQRTQGLTGHLGASFNGDAGQWRWTLAANYDRGTTRTLTDIDAASLAGNSGRTRTASADVNAVARGPLFRLPAGPVATSIRFGGSLSDLSSRSVRFDAVQSGHIDRDIGNGQINLDVPLTSRRTHTLDAVGDLSLNLNLAADHLSDFGTLTTVGYGANWSPIPQLRVIASVTHQDDAPTPDQLGDPVIVTPGVRVFDFTTGTTVTATRVAGGNAALIADNRRVFKLGLTAKPLDHTDLTFTANYVTTRTRDPIASFPGATAAIEAAFPDRFTRDADGVLTRIDSRPVNFARSATAELRYGFDLSVPLKSAIQKQFEAYRAGTGPNPFDGLFPGGRPGGGERGAGGPGGGGRGFGGRGGGGGRLQFALYHTWHFRDTVLVRDGGPSLDLLDGQSLGGAGQPRHELEGQAGYSNNGLGARLSANWQSGTRVAGGTVGDPDALRFSALSTFDLRLFADLSQRLSFVKAHPWARGMRITLAATNLFDRRQRVTDATGATPVSYQPDYLDPLGRAVRLSVRKLFF